MFIFTTKISKKKIIAGVLLIGAIISAIILLRPTPNADDVLNYKLSEAELVSITVGGIKTNEDRRIYLSEKGYDVSDNEVEVKKVQIPTDFDDVYEKYNEMQKKSGFDLSKFKGKTVEMYTYEILNHKESKDGVFANILIYKNKIIGGDISSAKLDGFMQGI